MGRRWVLGLALAAAALAGCRPSTVSLGFRPAVGDRYEYRYEITATITTAVAGEEPVVTEVVTTLATTEEVIERTDDGTRLRVEVRRDGGVARPAVVVVDRAGAILAVEDLGGIGADALGASTISAALLAASSPPPSGPVSIGDEWTVDAPAARGTAELSRLAVRSGHRVAVVDSDLRQPVDESVVAGASAVALVGELRTTTSTSYDLADGALRGATARSTGTVQARIAPPLGSAAAPVDATLSLDLVVTTARRR